MEKRKRRLQLNADLVVGKSQSDLGLAVLTSLSLGKYGKVSVCDFPVKTERSRLISSYY